MRLFDRIRDSFTKQEVCPPEHLEGYRRIGEEVYEAKVELADNTSPRVQLLLRIASAFQTMADGLLRDVLSNGSAPIAEITHEQAETWYGHIPDLLIAARKESVYPGSGQVSLPMLLGLPSVSEEMCPLSHLIGLRRAANDIEALVSHDVELMRLRKDEFREVLLVYEEARTRRSTADALIGSIMGGQHVPHQTHEDAREQYWKALSSYLLVVQGTEDSAVIQRLVAPPSSLDKDDPWRVTAELAITDIREAGEFDTTEQELKTFWSTRVIPNEERQYESAVERLRLEGAIEANGYWYKLPFQPVYIVRSSRVEVGGKQVSRGHEFVWDYPVHGQGQGFLTRSGFRFATERMH